MFQSRFQMFCNAFSMRLTDNCFYSIYSRVCRFVFYQFYICPLFGCVACTRRLHIKGDRGIKKYRNVKQHKTHRRFCCYTKATLMGREHRNNSPTSTAVGHRDAKELNNDVL